MSHQEEPKPLGLGRGKRHTKEANATMDAWKAAVDADLAAAEARLDALEGGTSETPDDGTTPEA